MPIITPPSIDDSDIPEPVIEERSDNNRIRAYLNCPNWKCVECGATMFGRCKFCVYCHFKYGKHTPRPEVT